MAKNVTASLSSFPQFNTGDDFIIFKERFENQLELCGIANQSKTGILIASLSADAYKLLKTQCDPHLPRNMDYGELMAMLVSKFVPKEAEFRERRKFYTAFQTKKDSVNDWFLRIKAMAQNCSFGPQLSFVLKDRFVSGLLLGPVFDWVAKEKPSIPLDRLVQIAIAKEDEMRTGGPQPMKERAARKPHHQFGSQNNIDKFDLESSDSDNFKQQQPGQLCWHCGKGNHKFSQCKFRHFKCHNCNQIGHTVAICKHPNPKRSELPDLELLHFD